MDALQLITLVIAILGAGLGVVNAYVQWQTYRRDKTELTVGVTWGMPTYGPGMGTHLGDPMIIITATNTGRHPLTVTGMQLELASGSMAPFTDSMATGRPLGLLGPGEHTAMWMEAKPLEAELRRVGGRLARAVVNGPGSQRWVQTNLGGIAKLGS